VSKFRANVQYDDCEGTAAADVADQRSMEKLLEEKGSFNRETEFLAGIEFGLTENHRAVVDQAYVHALIAPKPPGTSWGTQIQGDRIFASSVGTPTDIAGSVAFALLNSGRKRVHDSDQYGVLTARNRLYPPKDRGMPRAVGSRKTQAIDRSIQNPQRPKERKTEVTRIRVTLIRRAMRCLERLAVPRFRF
jgi:hypothetical protein